MELAVGGIYEGKVTGITRFGAFVGFDGGKSGLVHISEISETFVNDIHDFVKIGQLVRVKVLSIGNDGKMNLSIKKAEESPRPQPSPSSRPVPAKAAPSPVQDSGSRDFEDRLKKFMQESDSRLADNRMYADRRQKGRRR